MILNILQKLGIKSITDLNTEEQKTFSLWQKELNSEEITIKELKEFIDNQIIIITEQLLSYKNTKDKDIYLKVQLRNYRMITAFIESPETRKKLMEKYLDNLKGGGIK